MENDNLPKFGARKKFAKAEANALIKSAKISEIPVSLRKIIEHLQTRYSLDVQKIEAGEKVSGLLVVCKDVDSESAVIGFNPSHSWYRNRFTIAHEIGHLLLDHSCSKVDDNSLNETEANQFASELLMPLDFLKKDFAKTPNVKELSYIYKVSEQSLAIRLMECRLI